MSWETRSDEGGGVEKQHSKLVTKHLQYLHLLPHENFPNGVEGGDTHDILMEEVCQRRIQMKNSRQVLLLIRQLIKHKWGILLKFIRYMGHMRKIMIFKNQIFKIPSAFRGVSTISNNSRAKENFFFLIHNLRRLCSLNPRVKRTLHWDTESRRDWTLSCADSNFVITELRVSTELFKDVWQLCIALLKLRHFMSCRNVLKI